MSDAEKIDAILFAMTSCLESILLGIDDGKIPTRHQIERARALIEIAREHAE